MTTEYTILPGNTDRLGTYYSAKYKLLCGKGYGSFTIWEVTLSYVPDDLTNYTSGKYADFWEVVGSGSVGSPALCFGSFAAINEGLMGTCASEALVLGVDKSFLKSHATSTMNSSGISLKPPLNTGLPCRIVCASANGQWLFGGLDELVVFRYVVNQLVIYSMLFMYYLCIIIGIIYMI